MFKVSAGTLCLLAAPAEEQKPRPEGDTAGADILLPSGVPSTTAEEGQVGATASDLAAGNVIPTTAPAPAREGRPGSEVAPLCWQGKNRRRAPTAVRRRAHAALVATVRPQLELLAGLSRAVGHGEAALVCASILRDEAGAMATLR